MRRRLPQLLTAIRNDSLRDRWLWLLVATPVGVIYLLCAHWSVVSTDATAAAWPAWSLVHHGTLHLDAIPELPANPWFVSANGHVVSSRMPGVVLVSAPLQAMLAWTTFSAVTVATITAVLLTAAAVATMAVLMRHLASACAAIVAAAVLAFGTSLWTIAGAELWTHGPDALCLSAALLALHRRRHRWASIFLAYSVLTRPHLALVVLVIGVTLAVQSRQWRQLAIFGVPAAAALALVALYNQYLFGRPSIAGGTYAYASDNALGGSTGGVGSSALHEWLVNTAGLLASPLRGLFFYAPIVILCGFGLRAAWKVAPSWCKGTALGGLAYLLLQARINTFAGGGSFYGSRLTIEPLVLWTPLLFLAALQLWSRGHRLVLLVGCWLSVSVGVIGATLGHLVTIRLNVSPWTTWGPTTVIDGAGSTSVLILAVLLLALPLMIFQTRRPGQAKIPDSADMQANESPQWTGKQAPAPG